MAQLVEHILGKDEVTSSNLVISSKNLLKFVLRRFLLFILHCTPFILYKTCEDFLFCFCYSSIQKGVYCYVC